MSYDLQGSASMRFAPEGLNCRLTFRLPSTDSIAVADVEAGLAPAQA
jgi:hypothetical protein